LTLVGSASEGLHRLSQNNLLRPCFADNGFDPLFEIGFLPEFRVRYDPRFEVCG
jgi:hypothetical protein